MTTQTRTRRKKAAAPAVEPATGIADTQPPAPQPVTRVALSDLWEMRLAQSDKRTAEAKAEAARFQRLYALAKIDPKGIVLRIEQQLEEAKKEAEKAENRALIAKKRMEYSLGRPLTGLSIDPDSGEVQQG